MKKITAMAAAVMTFASCATNEDVMTLLVGTYTGSGSEGIYAYQFDQNEGRFAVPEISARDEAPGSLGFAEICNPSFLTISGQNIVYAVTEKGDSTASLTSFRFDPESFGFEKLGTVPSMGGDPCYVSTDGDIVATANYSGGTMGIFPIGDDGAALPPTIFVEGSATGPDARRQAAPHVHCCVFSPDGKYLFASDFSGDRIIRYDIATGETAHFAVRDDSGPRHIVFSPSGGHMYVISELSGDVTVFACDGGLTEVQVIKADKVGARGAADIRVSPDGRFLYASLRLKNDGIAVFSIGRDGLLTEAGYTNTGGHPRNFTITPNGRFLLCACRDTNSVEVYSIDENTGLLAKTGEEIRLGKPVCLVWVK